MAQSTNRTSKHSEALGLIDLGRYNEAVNSLLSLNYEEQDHNTREYAVYCCDLGSALMETGKFQLAIQYFEKAKEYHESHDEISDLGRVWFNLGNVYKYSGSIDIAISDFLKALDYSKRCGNRSLELTLHLSLGNYYAEMEDLATAKYHLEQIEEREAEPDHLNISNLWLFNTLKGLVARIAGHSEKSLQYLSIALDWAQRSRNSSYVARATKNIAIHFVENGQIDIGVEQLFQAEKLLREIGDFRACPLRYQILLILLENGNISSDYYEVSSLNTPVKAKTYYDLSNESMKLVQVIIADVAVKDRDGFISSLSSQITTGLICVFHSEHAYLAPLPKCRRLISFATDEAKLRNLSTIFQVSSREQINALRSVTIQVVQAGIEQKNQNDYSTAFAAYKLGLWTAVLDKDATGIDTLTANIWMLTHEVQQQLKTERHIFYGSILKEVPNLEELKKLWHEVGKVMEICTSEFASLLWELNQPEYILDRLLLLKAIRRSLELSEASTNRQISQRGTVGLLSQDKDVVYQTLLTEMCRLTDILNNPEHLIVTLYEELTCVDAVDLLLHSGFFSKSDQTKGKFRAEFVKQLWRWYETYRSHLSYLNSSELLPSCSLAVANLAELRSSVASGGYSPSQLASFSIAPYHGLLGRDFIRLLMSNKRSNDALLVAEHTVARALTDWMFRTHVQKEGLIYDSLKSGLPGRQYEEIHKAAVDLNSPILYYIYTQEEIYVWLIRINGEIIAQKIKTPSDLIYKLFKLLPYKPPTISSSNYKFSTFFMDPNEMAELNTVLTILADQLIPKRIRAIIDQTKSHRLTIITDRELNFVPFACLRINGQYLIENYDLLYLPSISSWMLCESEIKYRRGKYGEAVDSIILGDPSFSSSYATPSNSDFENYNFEKLPATALEAQTIADMLGVTPLLGDHATLISILSRCFGEIKVFEYQEELSKYYEDISSNYSERQDVQKGNTKKTYRYVPILHLATHGFLDVENPETSFLALADELLTSGFLHKMDGGLPCGLVMLSACQTGLGVTHSDSIIGLTNAFFIAGACSVGSTLWKVPDDSTHDLMENFYTELLKGSDLAYSISEAQRIMLRDDKRVHPLFWGAFKMAGSNANPLQYAFHSSELN